MCVYTNYACLLAITSSYKNSFQFSALFLFDNYIFVQLWFALREFYVEHCYNNTITRRIHLCVCVCICMGIYIYVAVPAMVQVRLAFNTYKAIGSARVEYLNWVFFTRVLSLFLLMYVLTYVCVFQGCKVAQAA